MRVTNASTSSGVTSWASEMVTAGAVGFAGGVTGAECSQTAGPTRVERIAGWAAQTVFGSPRHTGERTES